MSRRLIFHIGMPKTGSTAIQQTLSKNRTKLRSAGILYPKLEVPRYNHRALGAWLFEIPDEVLGLQIPEGISLEAFSKAQCDAVIEQAQGSEINDIIISSESFHKALDEESIGRLKQLMQDLNCTTMTALIYIRDPAAWFLSLTQEALKKGRCLPDAFPNFSRERVIRLIESYSMLPGAEMIARCFDRSRLVGGDVVTDFMTCIGHGDFPLDYSAQPQNVSLSTEAMRYLEKHNTHVPKSLGELKTRRRMVEKLKAIDARLKAPTKPELNRAARDYIFAHDASLTPLRQAYKIDFPSVDYSKLSEKSSEKQLRMESLDDLCGHDQGRFRRLSLQMKLPFTVIKILAKWSKLDGMLRAQFSQKI